MDIIDQICSRLAKNMSQLYITRIIKSKECCYVYISDKYGNDPDVPPLGFNVETGDEVGVTFDFDPSGTDCEVPEKYKTFRTKVIEKLYEDLPDDRYNSLGPYGLYLPVNALYTESVRDVDLCDVYAICNYFVNLFADVCDDAEKKSYFTMIENPIISEFIQAPPAEKMKRAEEYYIMLDCISEYEEKSREILNMAMDFSEKREVNKEELNKKKSILAELQQKCLERISETDDPFCSQEMMTAKVERIAKAIEQEIAFCSGDEESKSERMLARMEMSSFEVVPFSINATFEDFWKLFEEEE